MVVLVAAVLVQVGMGRLLRPALAVPFDLFLVLTVFYAGSVSRFWSPILGAVIGLLADALSTREILGSQAFAFALTAYAAAALNELFVITAGIMKLLTVFGATFLAWGAIYAVDLILETPQSADFPTWDCAREALVNALVAPLLMGLLARWHRQTDQVKR